MEDFERLENEIEKALISNKIKEINLYQVENQYFELKEDYQWLIDAGIELVFENSVFTVCWNSEMECVTCQMQPFEEMYEPNNYSKLDSLNFRKLKSIYGTPIEKVEFKAFDVGFIEDYQMNIKYVKMMHEICVYFEGNLTLQLACVSFDISDSFDPINISYDNAGQILMSLNSFFEIREN
jgi:hypothetical protein